MTQHCYPGRNSSATRTTISEHSSSCLQQRRRAASSYIYTTATPPLLAHALLESLNIIASETWRRDRLQQLIRQFTDGVKSTRWKLLPSNTPIQALIIGGNERTLHVSAALSAMGIEVPAIRPPTVAPGTARLRVSLSAAHSEADVAKLVDALHAVQSEL